MPDILRIDLPFHSSGFKPHVPAFVDARNTAFETAFDCAIGKYDDFAAGTLSPDISIRQALTDCGWTEPSPDSLDASLEWYSIEFDVSRLRFCIFLKS